MIDEPQEPIIDITDEADDAGQAEAGLGDATAKNSVPLAVALKHERDSKKAPMIVASGRGAVAEQILQLAFANGVKVREDADLVEVLSHMEIDSPIPLEAYAAVAEILAYVYKANASYKKGAPQ